MLSFDCLHDLEFWKPCEDFRKGRYFFYDLTECEMGLDPYDEDLASFFTNQRHKQLRIFHCDSYSIWLASLYINDGTYNWEKYCPDKVTKSSHDQAAGLLGGSQPGYSLFSFGELDRVVLWQEYLDFRKGRNFFYSFIEGYMEMDPLDVKAAYLFTNRRHNQIRVFHYDGRNTWLINLRTHKGVYHWNDRCPDPITCISAEDACALLAGG